MKTEIDQAVKWLGAYLSKSLSAEKLFQFEALLLNVLSEKFHGHWFPERPHVGNAFRAVSISCGRADACLDKVLKELGLGRADNYFPADLCLWIDPHCVAYKVAEYGHPTTLYCDEQALQELNLPVYFKSPTTRTRSPYTANGAINVNGTTLCSTSPPTSNNTTSAAIPITRPPATTSSTNNFIKNAVFSQPTQPASPYGRQAYMLVSAQ